MHIETMAKPKRFTPEQFKVRLNHAIERLIDDKRFIVTEEQSDIRVGDIAQIFNVNVATLRRWCAEFVQQSPSKYLAEYRITKAKKLLHQNNKPSEVSQLLAFTAHKTFSTSFKRVQGITPSVFMNMLK